MADDESRPPLKIGDTVSAEEFRRMTGKNKFRLGEATRIRGHENFRDGVDHNGDTPLDRIIRD